MLKQKLIFGILFLLLGAITSCKPEDKETQKILPKKTIKTIPEARLDGQFIFDLTQEDKSTLGKNSRSYMLRKEVVNSLNLDITFYGDGNGVMFHDDGKYEYMTKKMIENAKFTYKITNDTLTIYDYKETISFGKILDESINKDYFEIEIFDLNEFGMTFGMYKIADSPK